jgi:hypothetical protein
MPSASCGRALASTCAFRALTGAPMATPDRDRGYRRRCAWCAVKLRSWQLNLCRKCKHHVVLNLPSPAYPLRSRWDDQSDRMRRWQ